MFSEDQQDRNNTQTQSGYVTAGDADHTNMQRKHTELPTSCYSATLSVTELIRQWE